jgi:tRNA 2-selenouridine synthase
LRGATAPPFLFRIPPPSDYQAAQAIFEAHYAYVMVEILFADTLFQSDTSGFAILDVRSPAEYEQGHIPGALNLPLFSDYERERVGIAYKKHGPKEAMQIGLEIVGPKMTELVRSAQTLRSGKPLVVHCWRGGKRSESVGWLLDFAGMPVSVIEGGYKAYRTYQRSWLTESPLNLIVLGGKTGSGKTDILHALSAKGEQVLDLENLAHHKGSAFGWIGEEPQPSTEQFENNIFEVLRSMDLSRPIWVENESLTIGRVFVPQTLWHKMNYAPLIHLEVPIEDRIQNLIGIYAGGEAKEALILSFQKIASRLGGQHLKSAIESLERGDYRRAAEVALTYYDKAYYYGLENSKARIIEKIKTDHLTWEEITEKLHSLAQHILTNVVLE